MAFVKISEQPSLYNDLEKKSVHEILTEINTEDHKVADAVQKAIPQIEKLVTQIGASHEAWRTYFLYGSRHFRTSRSA